MPRCQHSPVDLFDPPPQGDTRAAVLSFLNPYANRRIRWVICARCGHTGYWGGYGFKRRVRWGYGDDNVLKSAEHHNRQMQGDAAPSGL